MSLPADRFSVLGSGHLPREFAVGSVMCSFEGLSGLKAMRVAKADSLPGLFSCRTGTIRHFLPHGSCACVA